MQHLSVHLYILDEKLSHWAGGGGYATTGAIGATAGSGGDVVDDCGLKFLLAVRQHTTLLRSLPLGHRASLEDKVLLDVFWIKSSSFL